MTWLRVVGPGALSRLARRAVVRWVIGLTVLVALLWLAAARGLGMGSVVPWALSRSLPATWSVHVVDVEGDWRSRMTVRGLELQGPGTSVHLPEAELEYRLGSLVRRRIELRSVRLTEPSVDLTTVVATDTAPDITPPASDAVATTEPSTSALALLDSSPLGEWILDVARIEIAGGGASIASGDGDFRVSDARLSASMSLGPTGLSWDVDTLRARFLPPDVDDATQTSAHGPPADLTLASELRDGVLTIERLSFMSERSDVRGDGRLLLRPGVTPVDSAELELRAAPLDLRDLPLTLPPELRDDPELQVELRASGAGDSLVVDTSVRGPLQIGAEVHAVVRGAPPGARPPFTVAASLEHDPRPGESDPPFARDLRIDLTVDYPGTDQRIAWNVELGADSMSLVGDGTASWDGARRLEVARLAMRRLDASRVWVGLPETAVSGDLRGVLTGLSVDSLAGELWLDLDSSSFTESTADTVSLHALLTPGAATGSLLVEAQGTRLETRYAATLRDSVVVADLTGVRVDREGAELPAPPEAGNIDGAPSAAGDAAGPIRAHGDAHVEWRTGGGQRLGRLDLTLDSASAGGVALRTGTLDATLEGDRLTGDALVEVSGALPYPLSARASVDASVANAPEVIGTLNAAFARADGELPSDSLLLTVSADRPDEYRVSGALRTAAGERIALDGRASATGEAWAFDAAARGALREPTRLLPDVTVDSLAVTASGVRAPDGWDRISGSVALSRLSWRSLVADTADVALRSDTSGLRLDTLWLASNAFDVAGSGTLPGPGGSEGRIDLVATLVDAAPLADLVGVEGLSVGEADLRAAAAGTLDSVSVVASAEVRAIVFGRTRVTGLDVDGDAMIAPPLTEHFGLTAGTLRIGLDRVLLPDARIGSVEAELVGGPDTLRLDLSALVDEGRRGSMLVRIDPRTDRRTADIERVDLQLDRDAWSLRAPARFTYRNGYALRDFVLDAGGQSISLDGAVDSLGALDVRIDMDSTDIGTVADLAGFPGLRGWVGGTADLTGTLGRPEGTVRLDGAFHRTGATPAPAEIRLEADGTSVFGTLELLNPEGGELRVEGSVGLGDDLAPADRIDVAVHADAFGLAWALPFTDPDAISDLGGTVDADLTVRGSPSSPDVEGTVAIRDGLARIPPLGLEYVDVSLSARAEGRSLVIESASVTSGSGNASASGTVALGDERSLDIDLSAEDFQAIRNEVYHASVSGDLHVGGAVAQPNVEGTVRVESLDVYLDRRNAALGLEDVELTDEDLRMLRERFGFVPERDTASAPVSERLTADLTVELGRDSWLRKDASPEMAVAFTGDLQVAVRPGEEPDIQGSVQTIAGRGFVRQFGRRFDLREGSVSFDGPPSTASLDLSAAYTIPSHDNPDDAEATIVLEITGTQDSLSLVLSSEPPMENADIVSYLATGRPASGTLSFGRGTAGSDDGGLATAGAGLALDQLTGAFESAAARSVGLDVVEIRRDGIRGATLVAGKYLSPRLYVGFAQPVALREGDGLALGDQSGSEIEIEIEALRWLLLNIEGSESAISFFLRGRHAF